VLFSVGPLDASVALKGCLAIPIVLDWAATQAIINPLVGTQYSRERPPSYDIFDLARGEQVNHVSIRYLLPRSRDQPVVRFSRLLELWS